MKNFTSKFFVASLIFTGVFGFFSFVRAADLDLANGEIQFVDENFYYQTSDVLYNLSAQPTLLTDLAVFVSTVDLEKNLNQYLGKIIKDEQGQLAYVFPHNGVVKTITYPDWQLSLWEISNINASIPRDIGGVDQSVELEIQEAANILPAQIVLPEITVIQQLTDLVNQERTQYQLPALLWDEKLASVAQAKSDEMNQLKYFAHVSPDGLTPGQRLSQSGYNWLKMGENLAHTVDADIQAVQVFQLWKNSATHYANILSKDFQFVGIARQGNFWAQEFAKR